MHVASGVQHLKNTISYFKRKDICVSTWCQSSIFVDQKMETCEDTEQQSNCLICQFGFGELEKAMENRHIPGVRYSLTLLLTCHLDFGITEQDDIQTLMHRLFNNITSNVQQQMLIIEILELLIDGGANINAKDSSEQTVLHLAVKYRLTLVIDFLISHGANLHIRDKSGNSIVHFLIETESYKFVKFFESFRDSSDVQPVVKQSTDFITWMIINGLDVDCRNNDGQTALHLAAKFNLLSALPILLEHTRDVRIVDACNMTALQVFIEMVQRFDEICRLESNERSKRFYFFATMYYGTDYFDEIYKIFLYKEFSIDVIDGSGCTPLHRALKQDRVRVVKLMLMILENVNVRDQCGKTALRIVVDHLGKNSSRFHAECHEIARILVSKGADVYQEDDRGISPLLAAILYKQLSLLKMFKKYGADISCSAEGSNLLHSFCKLMLKDDRESYPRQLNLCCKFMVKDDFEDYQRVIQQLVCEGCDVNAKDAEGMTPLHFVARCRRTELAQELIDCGADVYSREFIRGYTPLHEAFEFGRENMMAVLKENGVDVNTKTKAGQTLLHLVRSTSKISVEKLIKLGVHLDIPNDDSFLPLHTAILHQDEQVMKELLKFGAEINDNTHVLDLNDYRPVYQFIRKHLMKLKVAKLPIGDELQRLFKFKRQVSRTHEKCLIEIESLKSYKFDESKSLYDLLHINRNSTCAYVENENLEKLIKSPTIEEQFPMYHVLISSTYYKAVERRKMLEPAKDVLHRLANIKLPELCLHEIFSYLSNMDLRVMLDGVKLKDLEDK